MKLEHNDCKYTLNKKYAKNFYKKIYNLKNKS